ncbi:hypothetical protein [Hamadaea tsunoensis]|uniref:hypothetical protein n=1 Tax=Hamadaea tsunoensis TaxID=53368 RepID=UPI000422967F|nr:hypothetical protein [Hamadaea tsunoensis]
MSTPEVVLAYWTEHRQQFRQSEDQRSVLTNYLLVITAGLTGLIAAQRFALVTLPAALLIAALGLYGALAVAKYHERASYHLQQARALTRTLKELGALADDPHLDEQREDHYRRHPLLHRVRLHWLWTGLHLAIAVFGAVLAVVILAV